MSYFSYFIKSLLGTTLFFLFLFLAAGTLHFKNAWIFFGLSVLSNALNLLTFRAHPELMNERLQAHEHSKSWDKSLLAALGIVSLVAYVTAGLDFRFKWSMQSWNLAFTAIGFILIIKGQLLFLVAKAQNKFFSSYARVQTEREHQPVSNGLYRIVRHPGYIGLICTWMGFPLLLNSIIALFPALIAIVIVLIRTNKEDTMLVEELPGYANYTQEVKYKLIPFII